MNKTQIEWVKNPDGSQGYTWNPITGCLNGCEYCYAKKLANTRLRHVYNANLNHDPNMQYDDPFYPRFWEDRLDELDYTTKRKHFTVGGASKVQPKGIFVCNMSDLFGIGVPKQWTSRVLDVIGMNHAHRFYLLTKQPQNLAKFGPFPDNCWVGVTADTKLRFLSGMNYLHAIQTKVKFISFEPLTESMLSAQPIEEHLHNGGIKWIIIGSRTQPTRHPLREWVDEIIRAADKAEIPVFVKEPMASHYGIFRQEMPANDKSIT